MRIIKTIVPLLFLLIVSSITVVSNPSLNPIDQELIKNKVDSVLTADSLNRLEEVNDLLKQAAFYLNYNEFDSVISNCTRITNYSPSEIPAGKLAEAYFYKGKAYRHLGLNGNALRSYLTSIQTLKYTKATSCRSELFQELGSMYYENGMPEKAIEKYSEAYTIEVNRKDDAKQLNILNKLIEIFKASNDLTNATFYQSERLLPLLFKHDPILAYELMQELSGSYVHLKKYNEAITLQVQLLEHYISSDNRVEQFTTLATIIEIYFNQKAYDKVFGVYHKAFNSKYAELPEEERVPEIQLLKARISEIQGKIYHEPWQNTENLESAKAFYDTAFVLYEQYGREIDKAKILLSIADVQYLLQDYKTSVDNCNQAISHLDPYENFEEYMYAFDLVARSYEKLDRFKLAYQAKNNYQIFKDSLTRKNERKLEDFIRLYNDNTNRLVFQSLEQSYIQQDLDTLSYEIVKLDNAAKDNEIQLLTKEKALQDYQLQNIELQNQQANSRISLLQNQVNAEQQQRQIENLLAEKRRQESELLANENQQKLTDQQVKFLREEQKVKQLELQQANTQKIIMGLSIAVALIVLVLVAIGYINIRKSRQAIRLKNVLIEENNQKLQEINEEKNKLIRIVAHDLKNPIASSLSMADLIRTQNTNLPEDTNQSLEIIRRSLRRMHAMIIKILDIKAIDAEKINIEPEAINVKQMIHYVVELFSERARNKNIKLKVNVEEVYFNVDRNYFSQILENLLSNAIKFSPEGKSIWIKSIDMEDSCKIMIKDEGPGFNKEDKMLLFNKYQTLSAKPTGGEKSTGLGLYIVKKYVDEMQGKVWVNTQPDHGASFFIEFSKVLEEA